jgi:hypothetical protein
MSGSCWSLTACKFTDYLEICALRVNCVVLRLGMMFNNLTSRIHGDVELMTRLLMQIESDARREMVKDKEAAKLLIFRRGRHKYD